VYLDYGKVTVLDKTLYEQASDVINSLSDLWTEKVIAGHRALFKK
jgi:hypothetical protein